MNKVILTGRLTADPELRQTQNGIASCRFTVAVNRRFRNDRGEYDADFISCQAWRGTAEFVARHFRKGQLIALEGGLRTGSYQDRNHSDITHYTMDVQVDNVEFVGGKNDNGGGAKSSAEAQNVQLSETDLSQFEEILSDGDLPF